MNKKLEEKFDKKFMLADGAIIAFQKENDVEREIPLSIIKQFIDKNFIAKEEVKKVLNNNKFQIDKSINIIEETAKTCEMLKKKGWNECLNEIKNKLIK